MRRLRNAIALLAVAVPAAALDPTRPLSQYSRDTWTQDQGLPQNSAQALFQDRAGYLWIGTQLGLVRFDGVRFVVFDPENTPAFASPKVDTIVEDRAGRLWLGTEGGLVVREAGAFRAVASPDAGRLFVSSLAFAPDGALWAGTPRGLMRLEGGRLVADRLTEPIASLAFDAAGGMWVGTPDFLVYRSTQGERRFTKQELGGSPDALLVAKAGTLWLGTDRALLRYENGAFRRAATNPELTAQIWDLREDAQGTLWIATNDTGLLRVAGGRVTRMSAGDGLGDDQLRSVLPDRQGNVWVGTSSAGVTRLKDGDALNFGVPEGLPSDILFTIFEDSKGTLWFGTAGGGALGRGPDGREQRLSTKSGLASDFVFGFLEDRDGSLWIATGGGIVRRRGGRFTTWSTKDGLPNDLVLGVAQDADGTLWISTSDGLAAMRDGRLRAYTRRDGLCHNSVRGAYRDSAGRLWAVSDGGIDRLEGDRFVPAWPNLDLGASASFLEDSRGTLWFGTAAGLLRLQGERAALLTTKDGMFPGPAHRILEDAAGDLWISGNQGVHRYRRDELDAFFAARQKRVEPRRFGRADGMRSAECYGGFQAAGVRTRDGRFWFPTVKGAAVFDPAKLASASAPGSVIESVVADETPLDLAGLRLLKSPPRQLRIDYTALDLASPESLRFRYRLNGIDEAWLEAGHRRTAYYTNLPPGDYTFEVAAGLAGGGWSAAGAQLSFGVAKPYHQTTPFLALAGATALGLALLAHKLRTRVLHARHDLLEATVCERTADLEQAALWARMAFEQAETLRAATEAVSGTLELQNVLQVILTELRKVVDYDSASVQELEGRTLRIIAGVGFPNLEEIVGVTFDSEDPSAPNREVVQKRATLILDDTSAYPLFSHGFNAGAPILSWIGVPLISGERLVGMLTLDKRVSGSYVAEDARLATAFASQAAVSIENARLFEAERRHAAEVESHAAVLEQAASALRESEERIRAVVETAHDAFVAMDAQGAITGWNAQAEAIFGWSRSEAMGRTVADTIIPLGHRPDHVRGLTRFLDTGAGPVLGRRLELTALHRDGRQFPVELTISALRSGDGSPLFSAFIRDITERRRAESRLQAQHAATRVLAEATSLAEGTPRILEAICTSLGWVLGAFWHVDSQAECLRCGETWHQGSTGLMEFEALTRRSLFQRGVGLPGRIWESGQPAWIQDVVLDPNFPRAPIAAKAGLHGAFGFPVLSGGVVIAVLEFFSPEIQRPDDDLLAMMAAVGAQLGQYIERKRAEAAVQEERRQLREIVTHAPVAMAILDRDARYVAHSDLWLKYWQVEEPSLVGRRHGVAVPQVAAKLAAGLAGALRGEVVQTPEDPFELKDGTRAYMNWTLHPWRGAGGGVDGVVIVVQNVDVLVKARQSAEEASRAKSAFVASMSHELRTPLNAILGFVQLMQRRPRDPEDRDQLAIINRSGEHLLSLINQVLSLAKIEAGRVALHPRVFDLALLVRSVADMFGERARTKSLSFDVQDPELPRAVRGDDVRVREILINLLGNAFKFTERGGVSLIATWRDGRARFDVEDTGPGLTPSEIEQLFVVFSQTEAGRQAAGGTGLGLALSREFARLMEGEIVVDSEKGRGTRFRVELGLPAAADAEPRSREERRVRGLAAGQKRLRMLVVDDNLEGRAVLGGLLAAVGFEVVEARDGREAVEAWRREAPDMIWMDVSMPVMDGLEATRTIRGQEREASRVPIVAVTASAFEHEREAVLAAGCDEFVPKPFREGDVFAVLTERLGVRFSYDEAKGAAAAPATAVLSAERFAAHSASWRERFRQAIVQGDTEQAGRLCDEIEDRDAPLAAGIRARLKAYRLDELEELL